MKEHVTFYVDVLRPKKKLIAIVVDGEDIEYPIGSILVIITCLRR